MKTLWWRWIVWPLRDFAYPHFKCEDCIGMREHGCWCDAMGASAPGVGPERWRVWLRRIVP